MTVRYAGVAVALALGVLCVDGAAANAASAGPSALAPAPAAAPKVGRIGIEMFGPAGLSAELRTRLQEAAAAGLRASGAQVVSWSEVERARAKVALAPCIDWACAQRLAKVIDTQHWLRGTCQVDASTYRLHLELIDAQTGEVQAARDDTCDICTEADVTETANVAASALKASFGRSASATATALSPRASAGTAQAGAPSGGAAGAQLSGVVASERGGTQNRSSRATSATTADAPLWRRVLPWVALAAAAGATAGGIYYLAINDRGIDCEKGDLGGNCAYYYDTLWRWGVPLVGAGAALATTGVVLLLTSGKESEGGRRDGASSAQQRSTRLVISGDRLTLAGTF